MSVDLSIEITVIVIYMAFLLTIGWMYRKVNHDVSDYFRSGGKATWWMVGLSSFVAGISAFTFTGNAGASYDAGWAVAPIYIGNTFAYLLDAALLGPWFRQLRVITFPEALRSRFGERTRQFYAWIKVIQFPIYAAMPLFALALFCAAVFHLNLYGVIVAVGVVVLLYSVMGGRWAVMSTDVLQGVLMMVVTLLLTILCLVKIGGPSGLFRAIDEAGLQETYAMVKRPDMFEMSQYTLGWAVAIFFGRIFSQCSMSGAGRYVCVKDGRSARLAALLSAGLMFVGVLTWFIPPMVARLLYADQVAAIDLPHPPDAAYVVISAELLPRGMIGLVVVAMFAATMSSLDMGLNTSAAMFTRDIYPALARWFGIAPREGRSLLRLGQIYSVLFGLSMVVVAMFYALKYGESIFALAVSFLATLSLPVFMPLILCLFVRRVPAWSAIVTTTVMFFVSLLGLFSESLFGSKWTFQQLMLISGSVGLAVFMGSRLFWFTAGEAYRRQTREFFEQMHRPVDFEKEIGQATDHEQLILNGAVLIAAACFISLLLLVPNSMTGRLYILAVAASVLVIGLFMRWVGARQWRHAQRPTLSPVSAEVPSS